MIYPRRRIKRDEREKGLILFFHPDLGIGGAERLVVDAAVGLQKMGYSTIIYTSHCDPNHCFEECRDGTLEVRVRGDTFFPASIYSRFTIFFSILRQLHLIMQIWWSCELATLNPAGVIVDQLSAGVPLIRLFVLEKVPVLFYCHFPDLLLARGRESFFKRQYRRPFDKIENDSMAYADVIAVNSNFTKHIVEQTWPLLLKEVPTKVIYPCVDTSQRDPDSVTIPDFISPDDEVFLSINRFERKKDIGLAIKAFADIPAKARKQVRLIVAGGYDSRVSENVQYHKELQTLAESRQLTHETIAPNEIKSEPTTADVLFLLSVPGETKEALLHCSRLLVYTPSNEHFGIVPLEAMLAGVPVLAANTGGPVETVVDGETGWLRDPDDVDAWSRVMRQSLSLPVKRIVDMGTAGADRVRDLFSRDQMSKSLHELLISQMEKRESQVNGTTLNNQMSVIFTIYAIIFVTIFCVSARLMENYVWGR